MGSVILKILTAFTFFMVISAVYLMYTSRDSEVPAGFGTLSPTSKSNFLDDVAMKFDRNASSNVDVRVFDARDINIISRLRHEKEGFDPFRFASLDIDHDGFLSENEIMVNPEIWENDASPLKMIDTDGDGRLSEREWNAPSPEVFPSARGAQWRRDESFMMSLRVLTKLVDWSVERDDVMDKANEIFDRADVDGDGMINSDESVSWNQSMCLSNETRHQMFQPVLCQRSFASDCRCKTP